MPPPLQYPALSNAIKVYENLSSKRLLVMERFKGVPLTDLDNIRSYSNNPEATLITALNTWSKSVMMADSFHAVSMGVSSAVVFQVVAVRVAVKVVVKVVVVTTTAIAVVVATVALVVAVVHLLDQNMNCISILNFCSLIRQLRA